MTQESEPLYPIRTVATDSGKDQPEPIEPSGLVERDIIAKLNAGAMLTFAVWSLPKETVLDLFKNAPPAFHKAYMKATDAYGVGEH